MVWSVCVVVVCVLLAAAQFVSRDPDSAAYATLAARAAQEPVARWIAPEWGGIWNNTGLFQEHPAGILWLPAGLARAGYPADQAAYAVGIGVALACLLLLARLTNAVAGHGAARAALVLLQLIPVAFVFRIRSNHEYPMLLCLLVLLLALDGVRRSWWWSVVIAVAVTAALLIKGVFVALVLLGGATWAFVNPLRTPGSATRPWVALAGATACAALVAVAYDAAYAQVTGTTFWSGYWGRQLGPVAAAAPQGGPLSLLSHAGFYLAHLVWLSAPWGMALVGLAVWWSWTGRAAWAALPDTLRRSVVFAMAFAVAGIALLSPSSRFAERYLFSPFYVSAAVGLAAACHAWPAIPRGIATLDRRVPALPALLWLTLMVLRLGLGPLLPRPRFW